MKHNHRIQTQTHRRPSVTMLIAALALAWAEQRPAAPISEIEIPAAPAKMLLTTIGGMTSRLTLA